MVQENSLRKKIVCIVGPTGSGKTKSAVMLAKIFNGQIISADSMQIYKNMDIGTAKVTQDEMQGVKHHCLDIVLPSESYSASQWKQSAEKLIEQIHNQNNLPIIAGGTGLYVSSLLYGYDFYETSKDDSKRNYYKSIAEQKGADELYQLLQERSPEAAARIDKTKTKAIIRQLEVLDSGKTLREDVKKIMNYDYLLIGLDIDRELLYDRINARVDEMVRSGLFEEVKTLVQNHGLTKDCQSAGAIGYREVLAYLAGEISKEDAINQIKQNSRHYAKRQLTWFRKMDNIIWVKYNDFETMKNLTESFLKETSNDK